MPLSINRWSMAGDWLAGPMVQTILALRMVTAKRRSELSVHCRQEEDSTDR